MNSITSCKHNFCAGKRVNVQNSSLRSQKTISDTFVSFNGANVAQIKSEENVLAKLARTFFNCAKSTQKRYSNPLKGSEYLLTRESEYPLIKGFDIASRVEQSKAEIARNFGHIFRALF